ncbi:hypothetical protein EJD97_010610 [Solanum chilense]|uniref:Uncharacterized protein n=1 Tax=Solanum chilense TaxID=4083 RepID=A0A6N2C972_SOLCI|nr:hypothetical protein EJD97_010610 [Solanum chilense]
MDSICGGSAMFNASHFVLMVSLKNKTFYSNFIPYATVILEKYNIVTWIAKKRAAYSSINLQLSEMVKITYRDKAY